MEIRKRKILAIEVLDGREKAMEALLSDPDGVQVLTAEEQMGHGSTRVRYRCRNITNTLHGEKATLGQLLNPESGNVFFKIKLDE